MLTDVKISGILFILISEFSVRKLLNKNWVRSIFCKRYLHLGTLRDNTLFSTKKNVEKQQLLLFFSLLSG